MLRYASTMSTLRSPRGANAARSRSHNRQLVMGHILSRGSTGRAEIARSSGLSTQAVSNIIAELTEDGLVVERGRTTGKRGLPAVQYAVNPEGGFAFGVEVRPDAILAALLDLEGQALFDRRVALDQAEPVEVAKTVLALYREAIEAAPVARDRTLGAGVVMPGPFGLTGLKGDRSELPDWQALDPVKVFETTLSLPVVVENDANAAAMAERVRLAPQGLSTFAYLYFGAGLGLGLISNGSLIAGAFGNAGEIGHIPVPTDHGSVELETVLSRLSVQQSLASAGQVATDMQTLGVLFAEQTPALMDWLDAAAAPLAHALLIIENLFDPQTVILGGAMPEPILEHLAQSVVPPERSVSRRSDNPFPRIMCGACGRMTATFGAAALVLNRTFTPQFVGA